MWDGYEWQKVVWYNDVVSEADFPTFYTSTAGPEFLTGYKFPLEWGPDLEKNTLLRVFDTRSFSGYELENTQDPYSTCLVYEDDNTCM
jgi:hypothetical protein